MAARPRGRRLRGGTDGVLPVGRQVGVFVFYVQEEVVFEGMIGFNCLIV